MAHIKLLCDVSELSWVFNDSAGIDEFLGNIVTMIARHMRTDVCSAYLYDTASDTLVLKATHGLNPALVNQIRLKPGEGITGLALKELRPIYSIQGSMHPNYKFFSGLNEEMYETFLAVPIVRGMEKTGVLVVQRKQGLNFTPDDIAALRAVSNQVANIIENARELISMREMHTVTAGTPPEQVPLKLIRGKAASGGFASGPSRVEMKSRALDALASRAEFSRHGLDAFEAAVARTRTQLNERQRMVEKRLSDAASLIFTAHLLLLQDDLFYGRIVGCMNGGMSAENAIVDTVQYYVRLFTAQENPLLREKADDIRDLSIRLFENLVGNENAADPYEGHIIVARDLLPSDILVLSSENVAGIVLIAGGVTSHIAVLSRSLGLPLIIADEPRLLDLPGDTFIALDGETGNVHIAPSDNILASFRMRENARRERNLRKDTVTSETFTRDGTKVTLYANINLLSDVKTALDLKCAGVGLYRTEFPFIIRNAFPTEEEQTVVYRKLVDGMAGKPVTFRTLDIGGDKILPYYNHLIEQNPFLGLRSIRFALRNIDLFRQQVRAILRAGRGADLGIMFPMITTLEELNESRRQVDMCIDTLRREGLEFNTAPRIGVMIEIPAIVEIIDDIAPLVDFFSIGTNDFVQYMLAVDRTNEKVAPLYLPHHPAVLRALNRIAVTAHAHGKPVSVCGDMAHQTEYTPFLLGIGIRALSVDAMYLPGLQQCISTLSIDDARKTADVALQKSSLNEIAALFGIRDRD